MIELQRSKDISKFPTMMMLKQAQAQAFHFYFYHLQGFERAFAVKSVVTSSCNCTFIQSTSILGFQVLYV